MRRLLVTSALPYANGPIHIGHLVEYVQTDVWVRFQKMRGHEVSYICADDTHGTAIMLSAEKAGISEEDWIARVSEEHQRDFAGFDVEFTHFGSTHTDQNREQAERFWKALDEAGLVAEKEVEQLFDLEKECFLADRQVRGICPKCQAEDQPGDNCSQCDSIYSATELGDPRSQLSDSIPEVRKSRHLFVRFEPMRDFIEEWTQSGTLPEQSSKYIANFLLAEKDPDTGEMKAKELPDWDVSRPGPYFGFEIPGHPGEYWYVWYDAPIGYVGATAEWCDATGQKLSDWWENPDVEIHHFIGKDIQRFHTLFWPAMLKTAGLTLPTRIHIHGFLMVDGEKMSKTKGTLISAGKYLEHLDPNALRYYYATRLNSKIEDMDLALEDFVGRVNSDLVGKIINLASRSAGFVKATGFASEYPEDGGLFAKGAASSEEIADHYEAGDYSKAIQVILQLAGEANLFVEQNKPWELEKGSAEQQAVASVTLNLFRQLIIFLAPVLPDLARKTGEFLKEELVSWDQAQAPRTGGEVGKFKHMMQRIELEKVQLVIAESAVETAEAAVPTAGAAPASSDSGQWIEKDPIADQIGIEEFIKIDLRIARILAAEHVDGAKKLLKLTLGLGGDERRQVFAGIKAAYEPEAIVGRLVVCVANLAPREMSFGLSEGMVVAAGPGGEEIFLLSPDEGAQPGMRLK